MKKFLNQLVLITITLSLSSLLSLSANAKPITSEKPTASDTITMKLSKRTTYAKPKRYHIGDSHFALYKAHIFDHASKVTFSLIGFTKANTTYKLTKRINTQGVNWDYLKGHGWILGEKD